MMPSSSSPAKQRKSLVIPSNALLENHHYKWRSRIRQFQHLFLLAFVCGYLAWSVTFVPSSSRYDLESNETYDAPQQQQQQPSPPPQQQQTIYPQEATMMLLSQRKQQLKNSTGYTPRQRLCSDGKTYKTHPELVKASQYFHEGMDVNDHSTLYDYSWAHVPQRRSDSILYNPQHRLVLQSSSGDNSTADIPVLACRLHPKITVKLQHFAHAMEQLYGCLDYWMDNTLRGDAWKDDDDNTPSPPSPQLFLLHNATDQADHLKSGQQVEFIKGVMEVLETQLEVRRMSIQQFLKLDGLELRPNDALNQTVRNSGTHDDSHDFSDNNATTHCHFNQGALQDDNNERVDNHTCALLDAIPTFLDPLQGFLFRHATEWNALIQKHYGLLSQQQSTSRCTNPRIRILSRKQTRRIVNADQLARLLNGQYVSVGKGQQQPSLQLQDVTVEYFENADLANQFRILQSTDILISGHGAQLTGLPFMVESLANRSGYNNTTATAPLPNTCKQLLELYPKHYALPYYFGSLAVQTGIAHSYMYLQDDGDEEGIITSNNETSMNTKTVYPWDVRRAHTYKERFQSRRVNLCPDTRVMMHAIVDLVRDWYTCCTANELEEGWKRL